MTLATMVVVNSIYDLLSVLGDFPYGAANQMASREGRHHNTGIYTMSYLANMMPKSVCVGGGGGDTVKRSWVVIKGATQAIRVKRRTSHGGGLGVLDRHAVWPDYC